MRLRRPRATLVCGGRGGQCCLTAWWDSCPHGAQTLRNHSWALSAPLFSNSAACWTCPRFIVTLRMVRHEARKEQEIDNETHSRSCNEERCNEERCDDEHFDPRHGRLRAKRPAFGRSAASSAEEKLALTAGQRAKIKPILQHLHDVTENVIEDHTLSHEERLARVRPQRQMADKRMREILSDEQKKKLDQYEKGPDQEMHGTLSGTPKPPGR